MEYVMACMFLRSDECYDMYVFKVMLRNTECMIKVCKFL